VYHKINELSIIKRRKIKRFLKSNEYIIKGEDDEKGY